MLDQLQKNIQRKLSVLNVIIDKQFLNIVLSLITVLLESCSTAISVKGLRLCKTYKVIKSVFSKHKVDLRPILLS